jgi:hypothetical protein
MAPQNPAELAQSIAEAIELLSKTIVSLTEVKNAPEERGKLMVEGSALLSSLTSMQYAIESSNSTKQFRKCVAKICVPRGPLDIFKMVVAEFQQRLKAVDISTSAGSIRTVAKKQVSRILNLFDLVKSLAELAFRGDIPGLVQTISIEFGALTSDQTDITEVSANIDKDILQQNVSLIKRLNDQKKSIADWLSPLDFQPLQQTLYSLRYPGTLDRVSMTWQIEEWKRVESSVIWVHGIPGTGKSTYAATMIHDLQAEFKNDSEVEVLYLFCHYRDQKVQTLFNLLGCLLKQLLEKQNGIIRDIKVLWKYCSNTGRNPTISDVTKILQAEILKYDKVFIVVDGLDECLDDDGRRTALVEELRRWTGVRTMFLSRNIPSIKDLFVRDRQFELFAHLPIEQYIRGRFKREPHLSALSGNDETLVAQVVEEIVKKSGGM